MAFLLFLSFHLPERASHSPDKAPLALHIGFQIFCALLILCLLPQQHTVLKRSRQLSGVFQP